MKKRPLDDGNRYTESRSRPAMTLTPLKPMDQVCIRPTRHAEWQCREHAERTIRELVLSIYSNVKGGKVDIDSYQWLAIVGSAGIGKTRQGFRVLKTLRVEDIDLYTSLRYQCFGIEIVQEAHESLERSGQTSSDAMSWILHRMLLACCGDSQSFEHSDPVDSFGIGVSPETAVFDASLRDKTTPPKQSGLSSCVGPIGPETDVFGLLSSKLKGRNKTSSIVVIQLDEFQREPEVTQKFLRAVRDSIPSQVRTGVAIVPVLTGTSERAIVGLSSGLSMAATDYRPCRVYLERLSIEQTYRLAESILTSEKTAKSLVRDMTDFKVFISGASGVPRTAIQMCETVTKILETEFDFEVGSKLPWGFESIVFSRAWDAYMSIKSNRTRNIERHHPGFKLAGMELLRLCMERKRIEDINLPVTESNKITFAAMETLGYLVLDKQRVVIPPMHLISLVGKKHLLNMGISHVTLNPFLFRRKHDIAWNAFEHICVWVTAFRANFARDIDGTCSVREVFKGAQGRKSELDKKLSLRRHARVGGIKAEDHPFDEPEDTTLFLYNSKSPTADAWGRFGERVVFLQMKWSDDPTKSLSWNDVMEEYHKAMGASEKALALRRHIEKRRDKCLFVLITNRPCGFVCNGNRPVNALTIKKKGASKTEKPVWPQNLLIISGKGWEQFQGGLFDYSV